VGRRPRSPLPLLPLAVLVGSLAVGSDVGAAAGRAGDGNLLANPSFERSLAGWGGYRATLSRTAPGAVGARAVRVTLNGSRDDGFSVYPLERPVTSTRGGEHFVAGAWVRSDLVGRELCLRVREWDGDTVVDSAQSCGLSTRAWQKLPRVRFVTSAAGHQLDAYVFETNPSAGDSFDADGILLARRRDAQTPTAAPPPDPGGLSITTVDHAHVGLSWPAVEGAAGYRITRDGLELGTTTGTDFVDALLWPLSRYDYRVEALTGAGDVISSLTGEGATATLPRAGFPQPFAPTSVWRRPIGDAPLHPRSAAIAQYFADHARSPNMTLHEWGVAVAEARPDDSRYRLRCTYYQNCTLGQFGAAPIPDTARQDPEGDGHLTVYEPVTGRIWDMWQAAREGDRWSAGAGATVTLGSDGIVPPGIASGNAANFALLGGLLRPEELLQGRIDHPLVFGMPGVNRTGYVCPATHNDGSSTDPNAPMEGQWLQLDPAVDVAALPIPAWQKTIARALQTHGMYLRDSSGSFVLYAENPVSRGYDAWGLLGLPNQASMSLAGIPWQRMRVLQPPC
jgi:hypothetical protein